LPFRFAERETEREFLLLVQSPAGHHAEHPDGRKQDCESREEPEKKPLRLPPATSRICFCRGATSRETADRPTMRAMACVSSFSDLCLSERRSRLQGLQNFPSA
jgi:hypothetical protein